MKDNREIIPLFIRETRPIFLNDEGLKGIRFTLETREIAKEKNEGRIPLAVPTIRHEDRLTAEIDIPEAQVILWLQEWVETSGKKGGKSK